MAPPAGERLGDADEATRTAEPKPELLVRQVAQVGSQRPGLFQGVGSEQRSGADDRVLKLHGLRPRVLGRGHVGEDLARLVDHPVARIGEHRVGMDLELTDQPADRARQQYVVGVQVPKQRPLRELEAAVERCRLAPVVLTIPAEALRMPLGVLGQHLGRRVGRAVVDCDDLEVRVVLGQEAAERLLQQRPGAVVHRDHDRDPLTALAGLLHRAPPRALSRLRGHP